MIKSILSKYPYKFYAFGSRVKGTQKEFSDLDLLYEENIPLNIISHINEDFENSNLPFKVDLLSKEDCNKNFFTLIEKDLEQLF